ncbi:hypothetical protein BCR35DRAFT_219182 [Leucosporidium creatinivorum]|uniref:Uncharacterized protein n=1 Tax=Leucosporidium creatinivorum TaxID=106004 RepID=A0A1Y2G128_9BASI|nr:hypothetical protein BCR35DRAFT_219182 [Leucosporidium creatinivorum]
MAQPPWPPSRRAVSRSTPASSPAAASHLAVSPTKRTRDERDDGSGGDLSSSDGESEVQQRLLSRSTSRSTSVTSHDAELLRTSLESAFERGSSSGVAMSREGSREAGPMRNRPVTEAFKLFVGQAASSRREGRGRPSMGTVFGGDEAAPAPSCVPAGATSTTHHPPPLPPPSRSSFSPQINRQAPSSSSAPLGSTSQHRTGSLARNSSLTRHVESSYPPPTLPPTTSPATNPPRAAFPPSRLPPSLPNAVSSNKAPSQSLNDNTFTPSTVALDTPDIAREQTRLQGRAAEGTTSTSSPPGALEATAIASGSQGTTQSAPSIRPKPSTPPSRPPLAASSATVPERPTHPITTNSRISGGGIQRPSYSAEPNVVPAPASAPAPASLAKPPPSSTFSFLLNPDDSAARCKALAQLAVSRIPSAQVLSAESSSAPKEVDSSSTEDAAAEGQPQPSPTQLLQKESEMLILSDEDEEDEDHPLFTDREPPAPAPPTGPSTQQPSPSTAIADDNSKTAPTPPANPSTHRFRLVLPRPPAEAPPLASDALPPSPTHQRPSGGIFLPSQAPKKSAPSSIAAQPRLRAVKSAVRSSSGQIGGVIIPHRSSSASEAPLASSSLLPQHTPRSATTAASMPQQSTSTSTSTTALSAPVLSRPILPRPIPKSSPPIPLPHRPLLQASAPPRPTLPAPIIDSRPRRSSTPNSSASTSARPRGPRTRSSASIAAEHQAQSSSDDNYVGPTSRSLSADRRAASTRTTRTGRASSSSDHRRADRSASFGVGEEKLRAAMKGTMALSRLPKLKEAKAKEKARIERQRSRLDSEEDEEMEDMGDGASSRERGGGSRWKGKGRMKVLPRLPDDESSSSSDDECVVSFAAKDTTVEKRLQARAGLIRKKQAWEEQDPEDFLATSNHSKSLIITVTSVTLHLPVADVNALLGVHLSFTLHDTVSNRLIAQSARSNVAFPCVSTDPSSSNLRTFHRPPLTFDLRLDRSLLRSAPNLILRVAWKRGMDDLASSLPLTTSNGRLVTSRAPSKIAFASDKDPRVGLTLGWVVESVGAGRDMGVEEMVEETARIFRRLEVDEKPIWLPDALPAPKARQQVRVPALRRRRRGFDHLVSLIALV